MLQLNDEPAATKDVATKGDGNHLLIDDLNGAKVFVQIKGGKVARYYAGRGDGQEVGSLSLRMTEQPAGGGTAAFRCFICVENIDTGRLVCTRIPCPGGPISPA
jgi:hypothetical protein